MTNRSKQRHLRRKRRPQVDRAERVLPPPEAAQHHRAWPMQVLLALGPDNDGIDDDEFEAALDIVEAYHALTIELGMKALLLESERVTGSHAPMTDRDAERIACWFEWSAQVGPVATHIVEQIEDEAPIRSVLLLRLACQRWLRIKRDRARAIDKPPATVLTLPARSSVGAALPPSSTARSAPATLSRSPAFATGRSITGRRS